MSSQFPLQLTEQVQRLTITSPARRLTTTLHCETCRMDIATESGDRDDLVGKVHRQVDRKIRTGEWKNYVERTAEAQR